MEGPYGPQTQVREGTCAIKTAHGPCCNLFPHTPGTITFLAAARRVLVEIEISHPMIAPPSSQAPSWPALYMYPVNECKLFTQRILRLANGQHQKIRPTNKTTALVNRFNGNINAVVLSNPHADIWEENGNICRAKAVDKIYIMDLGSTQGTTVTHRGSDVEVVIDRTPHQLRDHDIIAFGRDFVNVDTGVTHPKVIARVLCILTEQQAQAAAKAGPNLSQLGKRQLQDLGDQALTFKRAKCEPASSPPLPDTSTRDWDMQSMSEPTSGIITIPETALPEANEPVIREERYAGNTKEFNLLQDSPEMESKSEEHEIATAPIVSRGAMVAAYLDAKIGQYGVLGSCSSMHAYMHPEHGLIILQNAPFSAVICGLQGSGKSHTLSVLLENMLIPNYDPIGTLEKPLSALVLHYGQGGATSRPSEAAWVGVSQTKGVKPPPVSVYVCPSSLKTMTGIYAPLGKNIAVLPLYFNEDELDAESFLSLMSVDEKSAPLYMRIVLSILRDLGENFTYSGFQIKLNERKRTFHDNQIVGLEQRMTLLEAFMARRDPRDRRPPVPSRRFAAGRLTIIDLTDPFMEPNSACGLFEIITRLFIRADVRTGKVLVVDEAHKASTYRRICRSINLKFPQYLTTNRGSSGLTNSLLTLTREQRHLAMRVLICTQEPTVIPAVLLDLCTVSILHRFASPSWWDHLTRHVSADFSGEDAFDKVVKLQTGEAMVLAPSGYGVFKDTTYDKTGKPIVKKSMGQFGRRYLLMKTRQRITADGGASVLVLKS
ncbi:hypothetical protein HWV62_18412 [Athelia sp. TMB]|nr:hypothetical protein HWV62_18412 [Athelia sp. TMB]